MSDQYGESPALLVLKDVKQFDKLYADWLRAGCPVPKNSLWTKLQMIWWRILR